MKSALLFVFIALSFTGCLSKNDSTSDASTTTTASRDVLNPWYVANRAWGLDLSSGNLSGSNFTMDFTFSDNSTCRCTTVALTGDNLSGSYSVANCSLNSGGGGSMAGTTGCSTFHTGGAGTYSNAYTSFTWCRANGACFTYYP